MTDDLFRGLRDEAGALDQQHQFLQAACFQSPEAMIARKAVIDFDVGSLTTFDLVIYEDPHINACYSFGEVLAVEDWCVVIVPLKKVYLIRHPAEHNQPPQRAINLEEVYLSVPTQSHGRQGLPMRKLIHPHDLVCRINKSMLLLCDLPHITEKSYLVQSTSVHNGLLLGNIVDFRHIL